MGRDFGFESIHRKEWSDGLDREMFNILNIIDRIHQRFCLFHKRNHFLTGFEYHLTESPADSNVANTIHRLEGRSSQTFLFRFLHNFFTLCRYIPARVYDSWHLDTFMENIRNPSRLEALHLQTGNLYMRTPPTSMHHFSILYYFSISS